MGMELQNATLLQHCARCGWSVDFDKSIVKNPTNIVEEYIQECGTYNWTQHQPQISSTAGVYHGLYLDPIRNKRLPWTEDLLSSYFGLATYLPHISRATMLGCQLPVPPPLQPLFERYICWKYGANECGSIYLDDICPYLLDLYQVYADYIHKPIEEVFTAAVFVVPHLKLGYHEAAQVQYFWERGLKVRIGGGMPTMGGTTPATFAGSVTLNLAEQLALNLLDHTLYGPNHLYIESSIGVLDMRTGIHPFGRPEQVMTNIMTAQIARTLGATFSGHAGLTDAKAPSTEAGMQKMMTAAVTLLTSGNLWVDAGLLSADEIYSPIQMILDNEMLSALKHWTREYTIDAASIGLPTIFEVGPGGHYMDQMHTAAHFREEHWQPSIWSRDMLQAWIYNGSLLDVDKARDVFSNYSASHRQQQSQIPDAFERELLRIINKAEKALV
jgi:hypothetical protein